MSLLTLWRRRKLALQLLEDYDRDNAPIDLDRARRIIAEFAASQNWTTDSRPIVSAWAEAVRNSAKDWPV